ncbi:TPR repeat-containing thioredoxin TTL1 isoform X2 [Amborella trichopoda]|uniref:Thioredoxin domain-containing protein n=1 Tax=Amborella trichopoda TaxID=13333 RepID=W1Q0Y7_AMBTC|nr:TPR repeat-containing thioredoxin TTL1 isoform X2 [Amborella trichopoda]ERN13895.1 hypothetical protein AMTR_s00021p00076440 [Amborella trichopoda]|eukprot:XP_006852428.3 TPR repeat-containing thioredoxin TTL1 isoform X2 [Amborella trichopoda]
MSDPDHRRKARPTMDLDLLIGRLEVTADKPDSKEPGLGSPVSPLMGQIPEGSASSSTTSSSGSSVTGKSTLSVKKPSDSGDSLKKPTDSGDSESVCTKRQVTGNILCSPDSRRNPVKAAATGLVVGQIPATGNVLPSGNIVPSGKVQPSSGKLQNLRGSRSDVLGSGTGNYGHGSVVRGGRAGGGGETMAGASGHINNVEEVKRKGNEEYRKGNMERALVHYERAIAMAPENAACHGNRAAALAGLGRVWEAVRECEEALRIDPTYLRVHQRLASLHLRLGQVENAWKHLCLAGNPPDSNELRRIQTVERHVNQCADARKVGDWKSALREGDAAIAAGAESCPQLFACRAEALLMLHRPEEADAALSSVQNFELSSTSLSLTKFFGMNGNSYLFFVRSQVDMTLGRFDQAVSAIERASQIDPRSSEIAAMANRARNVVRVRAKGNDLFNMGKFIEACVAYGEGLECDPSNPLLYCNRAACRAKLGQWERAIEDCNQALRFRPKYTKAILRRATYNGELEKWAEAVRDYEILRKELPGDSSVAEALFHAQVALKKSRGEDVHNMKFGGEVEAVSGREQFRAAISLPGVSVVHFKASSNYQCEQISPFVDALCERYPFVNFLKVDINESPAVANAENVRIVPTFKIYKNGCRVKEMICPTEQVLEYSVRHYSL